MTKSEAKHNVLKATDNFKDAYVKLLCATNEYEAETCESVNDLKFFSNHYPFDCALEDLPILDWANGLDREEPPKFKVLNYEYLNTGGNCMVGIFTVWLPALKQTVYVLTNELGCTITTVDYISNEIDIEDYDEVTIDRCDFDNLCAAYTHFELYRHCLNEYTKSDCRYFGSTYAWPYHLLSDELQSEVHHEYLEWCKENNNGCIPTDGVKIIVHPDYDTLYDPQEDYELKRRVVEAFKDFHDTTAGVVDFYSEEYALTFAGKTIYLPFMASVWDAVDNLLRTAIEEW